MTCTEADAVAGLYRACGMPGNAGAILAAHACHDEPGDGHYTEGRRSYPAETVDTRGLT